MENYYLEIINKKTQIEITNIKNCNELSSKYGLVLNDIQIKNLLEKRKEILNDKGRIEFRNGVIDKIIKEFCDSPYLNEENYVETLYDLLEIFYECKNETMDLISDDELIKSMKDSFDGVCQGNLDFLSGVIMNEMKKYLDNKKERKNE